MDKPLPDLEPEEAMQAISGLGGSAFAWIAALHEHEDEQVWRGLDHEFRLVLAQQWILDNPAVLSDPAVDGIERDTFAAELAKEQPTHPLWHHCLRVSMRAIRSGTCGAEERELGFGLRPRLAGLDLEVVHLKVIDDLPTDEHGVRYHPPGTYVMTLVLPMRHRDGMWRVVGIGERLPVPGWPPTWTPLPGDD